MARTTVKELENRINTMENKLDKLIDLFSNSSNGRGGNEVPDDKPSDKWDGVVKNSKNGTKLKITIVDGKGKGEGKQFISLAFSNKPSEKTIEFMKLNGFHYNRFDKSWGCFKTDKQLAKAQSLIK